MHKIAVGIFLILIGICCSWIEVAPNLYGTSQNNSEIMSYAPTTYSKNIYYEEPVNLCVDL